MFDSTEVGQVPGSANAVAGYVGGHWPTYGALVRRFPHAHVLSIAIAASEDASCLDVERGDATPQEASAWLRRQFARRVYRPVLYTSVSGVAVLESLLGDAGISRSAYRVWSAHYTGLPHVCGPACGFGMTRPADATQWTDRALGRNLDESLCAADFFNGPPVPPDPLAVLTPAERALVRTLEVYRRHPRLHPVGIPITLRRLVVKRKEVWMAAAAEVRAGKTWPQAWAFRNRATRYRILWRLTGRS